MFVPMYKALKRAKSLRGKPAWQDKMPRFKEQRDTYRIAAKHERKFARAFMEMERNLIDADVEKNLLEAWNKGEGLFEIMNQIPIFTGDTNAPIWDKIASKVTTAYDAIITDSGDAEIKIINDKLKTNIDFTKGDKVPVVPVNVYSKLWIQERALKLLTQNVTQQQMASIQLILQNAIERGLRGREVIALIKANLGLTARSVAALNNKQKLLDKLEYPKKQQALILNKYKDDLLKQRAMSIARTETIAAQAQGRNATWQIASNSGSLPPVVRIWISAPSSPNPNRPCEICEDLDTRTAPLGGTYDSIIGPIAMPPAHPMCRCSETIVRDKGE